jgi:hypothetical protein
MRAIELRLELHDLLLIGEDCLEELQGGLLDDRCSRLGDLPTAPLTHAVHGGLGHLLAEI